jgi:gliding motility-associated-like protein
MKFFSFLFLTFLSTSLCAQNLVLNGGLEIGTSASPFQVQDWYGHPQSGSPDYKAMPDNFWDAHSGNGSVGFYQYGYYDFATSYVREYITGTFTEPLEAGHAYELSFFVRAHLDDGSGRNLGIKEIGAYISAEIPLANSFHIIEVIPQIEFQDAVISDTQNWVEVKGCYIAQGGEKYVSIGNFNIDSETEMEWLPGATWENLAYQAIDDISLHEIIFPSSDSPYLLCPDSSVFVDLAHPTASYIWEDGSMESSNELWTSGTHEVSITINTCTVAEDILIVDWTERISETHPELTFCTDKELLLEAADGFLSYTWSTGNQGPEIIISQEGIYSVERSDFCLQTSTETFFVNAEDCSCYLYLPNSFSPNEDGVNDSFGPVANCELAEYEFQIIDRWGQVIFRTSDPDLFWNGGGISNYYVPAGIYSWLLSYRNVGNASLRDQRNGSVTVIH